MGAYKSPLDLNFAQIGIACQFMPYFNQYLLAVHHRNIKIIGWVDREDGATYDLVVKAIFNLRKEVNYYLDAIWC